MMLWLKVKDTKSESNSQQLVADAVTLAVVAQGQRYKIWKQFTTRRRVMRLPVYVVAQGQRYKIWKQFTTILTEFRSPWQLWLKVKDTKSESNSQLVLGVYEFAFRCGSRSKIQNLKAIHNCLTFCLVSFDVVAQGQRYKIWKQFTTMAKSQ